MKVLPFKLGIFAVLEMPDDDATFQSTSEGIRIIRGNHKDLFISYQDLVELLDGQSLLLK
jgi:hypothetical protein